MERGEFEDGAWDVRVRPGREWMACAIVMAVHEEGDTYELPLNHLCLRLEAQSTSLIERVRADGQHRGNQRYKG